MRKTLSVFLITGLLVGCSSDTESTTISSNDVYKAFENANLPLTDARDNSHNCDTLGCVSLITTEDVSIYEWKTEEEAKQQFDSSIGDGSYSNGNIFVRLNNKDLSIEEYNKVLDELFQ